jgi:predicted RNA methylase
VVVVGALGGNALSHMGRAVAQRRYNGGLATSFVMLPAAVQILRTARDRDLLTGRQVVAAAAGGNALAVPMIVLALTLARKILK